MSKQLMRGDTLIEVLLAVTIFSMVSVLSIIVMNRSSATAERSLETTLVKQQIDSQVEELRAAHQASTKVGPSALSAWREIRGFGEAGKITDVETGCKTPPKNSFYMKPTTQSAEIDGKGYPIEVASGSSFIGADDAATKPYAQVEGDKSYGIWIEKQDVPDTGFGAAYEFTVRACWYGAGLDVPMQLDTTVRLYDPI